MESEDMTGKQMMDAKRRGWKETDPKRIEFYCTITNDLAEGIVTRRITMKNLIEVIGWQQKIIQDQADEVNELRGKVAIALADDMLERMQACQAILDHRNDVDAASGKA